MKTNERHEQMSVGKYVARYGSPQLKERIKLFIDKRDRIDNTIKDMREALKFHQITWKKVKPKPIRIKNIRTTRQKTATRRNIKR